MTLSKNFVPNFIIHVKMYLKTISKFLICVVVLSVLYVNWLVFVYSQLLGWWL